MKALAIICPSGYATNCLLSWSSHRFGSGVRWKFSSKRLLKTFLAILGGRPANRKKEVDRMPLPWSTGSRGLRSPHRRRWRTQRCCLVPERNDCSPFEKIDFRGLSTPPPAFQLPLQGKCCDEVQRNAQRCDLAQGSREFPCPFDRGRAISSASGGGRPGPSRAARDPGTPRCLRGRSGSSRSSVKAGSGRSDSENSRMI